MLRRTVVVAATLLGVWAIGVSALAFVPQHSTDVEAGVPNVRYVLNRLDANVFFSYQDPSGKYTIFVRSPVRANSDAEPFDE